MRRHSAGVPQGLPATYVITPTRGLQPPDLLITKALVEEFAAVDVAGDEPRYFVPLVDDARTLADALPGHARVVLLGSVATSKYVEVLADALGARLHFPADFIGRGDMSRGALMLRSADSGVELEYITAAPTAVRRGRRPPRLAPVTPVTSGAVSARPDLESPARSLLMYAIALAVLLLVVACSGPAQAQSAAGAQLLPGMGSYSHPIQTTSPEAQKFSTRGSRCSTTSTTPKPSGRS